VVCPPLYAAGLAISPCGAEEKEMNGIYAIITHP
jgi:hypothetical protein